MAAPSFNFLRDGRLPSQVLLPWELQLREGLIGALSSLRQPFPILDWIEDRIGGEIESFCDAGGGVFIRHHDPNGAPTLPEETRITSHTDNTAKLESWFAKLPGDTFSKEETKLRTAIYGFLARWSSTKKATVDDLCRDADVGRLRGTFVPKLVPLKEWIQRRIGEEVIFTRDRHDGQEVVELTPSGHESLREQAHRPEGNVSKATKRQSTDEIPAHIRLSSLCGKFSPEPLIKGCIRYDYTQSGDLYRATVTLNCFNGEQFSGQASGSKDEARDSAAEEAIRIKTQEHPEVLEGLNEGAGRKRASKKRKASLEPLDILPNKGGYKSLLDRFCCRLNTTMQKGDILLEVVEVDAGQYQSTITLNFLEGQTFTGDVEASENEAKTSASMAAVLGIQERIEAYNADLMAQQPP